ncbi:MAG TPA: DUF4335 domain-containing protein [Coleofasciculaceae cyanobacterium]
MTIQRQYSLPNCILTLEGMDSLAEVGEVRPTLSVLLTVNCQFPAHNQAFVCDRRFFEQFAQTISQYAQSCLSGIRSPHLAVTIDNSQPAVMIAPAAGGKHKLMVMPPLNPEGPGEQPPQLIEMLLTPLQLFDLVETIDQFYGDPKTLPDSHQNFSPVSRRDLANAAPLVQRAAPVAVGASGLAVAAGVLFMLPVPKVEQPKDVLRPKPTPTPQSQSALPSPAQSAAPSPEQPSPQTRSIAPASPAAMANNAIPPSSAPVPAPAAGEAADGLTSPAPLLTNPQQLAALKQYLSGQLNSAWRDRQGLGADLSYRVSVGEDGAIVGYLPENAAAQASVDRTPLRQLLFTPLNRSRAGEPIAAFRVSFSPANGVQVISMKSTGGGGSSDPKDVDVPALDASLRDAARQALDQSLKSAWSADRAPGVPLIYDLRVTQAGTPVESTPANDNAAKADFPLPELLKPAESAIKGDNGKVQLAPLAQFQVVFWPDGSIDVRS